MLVRASESQLHLKNTLLLCIPIFMAIILAWEFTHGMDLFMIIPVSLVLVVSLILGIPEIKKSDKYTKFDYLIIDKKGIAWSYNAVEQTVLWNDVQVLTKLNSYPAMSVTPREHLHIRSSTGVEEIVMLNYFDLSWDEVSKEVEKHTGKSEIT